MGGLTDFIKKFKQIFKEYDGRGYVYKKDNIRFVFMGSNFDIEPYFYFELKFKMLDIKTEEIKGTYVVQLNNEKAKELYDNWQSIRTPYEYLLRDLGNEKEIKNLPENIDF